MSYPFIFSLPFFFCCLAAMVIRRIAKCDDHGEEEKYFCTEDSKPVCGHCALIGSHKGHSVVPISEQVSNNDVRKYGKFGNLQSSEFLCNLEENYD